MCALIQAIRKVGIVAGGPGLGDAKNPMHIVRDSPVAAKAPTEKHPTRPSTADADTSLGQNRYVVEDPSTNIDDGRRQLRQEQLAYTYYGEDQLDRQVSGTFAAEGLRVDDGVGGDDISRGKSFGRRRKQVQADLEKGPQH